MVALDYILQTERETLKFRLIALVGIVTAGIYMREEGIAWAPAVAVAVVYLAYTLSLGPLILARLGPAYRDRGMILVSGIILVDVVMVSAALHFVGGIGSTIFFLLPLFIIYHAIYLGYVSSFLSATLFSFCYVGLAFLEGEADFAGSLMAMQIPFFYLLAIFSGYLAGRRLEERREKQELQEFIRVESRAKGLLDAAKTIGKTLEIDTILGDIVDSSPRLVGLSKCLLALFDEQTGKLVARAGTKDLRQLLGLSRLEELACAPSEGSATALALERGRLVTAVNVVREEGDLPRWAEQLGVGALLVVPLVAKGQNWGVMYFFEIGPSRPISDSELKLAQSYGDLAANAIANAQLYHSMEGKMGHLAGELEATVRRMERFKEPRRKEEIVVGDLRIDGARERVLVNEKPISLSPTEFRLLYLLAENAGQPVNQETLIRRVWGEEYGAQTGVVDVSIHRLRRKIEKGSSATRILTIRGAGYMLSGAAQQTPR